MRLEDLAQAIRATVTAQQPQPALAALSSAGTISPEFIQASKTLSSRSGSAKEGSLLSKTAEIWV